MKKIVCMSFRVQLYYRFLIQGYRLFGLMAFFLLISCKEKKEKPSTEPASKQPNIILIVTDDQGLSLIHI